MDDVGSAADVVTKIMAGWPGPSDIRQAALAF
jgi:hypothetical protein